jgi:hypothetical protein
MKHRLGHSQNHLAVAGGYVVDTLGLCLKSPKTGSDRVSTTCGSGWVLDEIHKTLAIERVYDVPTRYRRWY